jgi:RNA polymerase sigma-70 factor (ECF subfamily)
MIESPDLDPEAEHVERELKMIIRQTVASLGQRSAEICALRYFEGYSNQEIARMMGTSQLVVGVVLHRARGRLRKKISKYMEGNRETN